MSASHNARQELDEGSAAEFPVVAMVLRAPQAEQVPSAAQRSHGKLFEGSAVSLGALQRVPGEQDGMEVPSASRRSREGHDEDSVS